MIEVLWQRFGNALVSLVAVELELELADDNVAVARLGNVNQFECG